MEEKDEAIKFHRPPDNDRFRQSKQQKDMMSYAVLFQCSTSAAYALFNREVCDKNGKLNKAGQSLCRQFFSHPDNVAYMEALKAHLSAATKGKAAIGSEGVDLSDERIDKAFRVFLEQAIRDIEDGKQFDNETFKIIMELFKKLGRFKDDVEVQEAPRRYLPERCGCCLYRSFVESHVESGDIVSECDFCRTRKFAEEKGWRFDATRNLEPEAATGPSQNGNECDS